MELLKGEYHRERYDAAGSREDDVHRPESGNRKRYEYNQHYSEIARSESLDRKMHLGIISRIRHNDAPEIRVTNGNIENLLWLIRSTI